MTGTFKIRKDKLKSIVFQDLKNISLIALISILFPIVMMTIIMPKEDMPIYIPIISLIFSISVIAGIIAYMYNFKIVYYEAYELTISEKGLHKRIDLDNNKMLSGLRAWAWNRLKLLSK